MKAKFYSLRALFFTLLLSFSYAETIKAQAIDLQMVNRTDGGDGTRAYPGDKLRYFITVTGPETMVKPKVACPVPPGTSYVPQSTLLNGVPFADQFNTMPWATAQLIPVPLPATNNKVIIQFDVTVATTASPITGSAELQTVNFPLASDQTITTVTEDFNCSTRFYALTTKGPHGYSPLDPSQVFPYEIIKGFNITTGSTGNIVYDGYNGACKDAYTLANLEYASVLIDATAMAVQNRPNRVYFINKPVNNVPPDLCYIIPTASPVIAYKYVNTPLTTNPNALITRMTMDVNSQGYAITDDGLEFIIFKIQPNSNHNADTVILNKYALSNDISNTLPDNNIYNERGGDIVCDGAGNLLLVTNSGKVYRINVKVNSDVIGNAKYLGTIPNFPAAGCSSVAIDQNGFIYIGGPYQSVYKLTLSALTLTTLATNAYANSDFAGCAVPLQPARIAVNEKEMPNEPITAPLISEVSARVQPNPFRKELNLQIQLTTAEVVKVRLVDFYGRTVYTTTEKLGAGTNSLRLPVPANLGSGIYVVDVWAGNNRLLQKKVVKQ